MLTISLKSNILRLNSIDSTNNFLANLVQASNIPNGTVVVTERQTNGRGQRGSSWSSSENESLTFSFFIDTPSISVWEISMRTALGIASYIRSKNGNPEVQIKWPNDIRINSKKCAGILIENRINKSEVKTIVGVGLNVNGLVSEVPNATSLSNEGLSPIMSLEKELNSLLGHLESTLNAIPSLKKAYTQQLLGYQTDLLYEYEGKRVYAHIQDITEAGQAIFKFADQTVKKLDLKEIKLLV